MDDIDRRIVNALQDGIEPVSRPFLALARELGLDEPRIVERIRSLLADGVLRRFAPMLDIERGGGSYCLCAMAVPATHVDEVAACINAFDEVAHNYQREHHYNLWFVLAAESRAQIARTADAIQAACNFPVLRLPKLEEFYIGLRFHS